MSKKSKGYYPTKELHEGFEEDFKTFLDLFTAKKSFEFKDFRDTWNEMNFNLIYSGRETEPIVEEFNDEVVKIVLNYALSEKSDLYTKACSVFMLYSLYHKTPSGVRPLARITEAKVIPLKILKSQLKNLECIEVQFVLCNLLRDGFFRFVITEQEYGLEKPYRKAFVDRKEVNFAEKFSVSKQLNEILESDDIGVNVIENVFKDYHNIKLSLPGSKANEPLKELQLVDKDFANTLKHPIGDEDGEDVFLGNKEIILSRKKKSTANKAPLENQIVYVTEMEPCTSNEKKRRSSARYLMEDYCEMVDESNVVQEEEEEDSASDVERNIDMPTM